MFNLFVVEKWGFRWDGQEIRFHLLGGISPEITTANEFMGDGPKRVVASVLYEAREKVSPLCLASLQQRTCHRVLPFTSQPS